MDSKNTDNEGNKLPAWLTGATDAPKDIDRPLCMTLLLREYEAKEPYNSLLQRLKVKPTPKPE